MASLLRRLAVKVERVRSRSPEKRKKGGAEGGDANQQRQQQQMPGYYTKLPNGNGTGSSEQIDWRAMHVHSGGGSRDDMLLAGENDHFQRVVVTPVPLIAHATTSSEERVSEPDNVDVENNNNNNGVDDDDDDDDPATEVPMLGRTPSDVLHAIDEAGRFRGVTSNRPPPRHAPPPTPQSTAFYTSHHSNNHNYQELRKKGSEPVLTHHEKASARGDPMTATLLETPSRAGTWTAADLATHRGHPLQARQNPHTQNGSPHHHSQRAFHQSNNNNNTTLSHDRFPTFMTNGYGNGSNGGSSGRPPIAATSPLLSGHKDMLNHHQNDDSTSRSRSLSPRKTVSQQHITTPIDSNASSRGTQQHHHRSASSRSPTKSKKDSRRIEHTFDYLLSQCHQEGCSTAIIVQSSRFLLCRHQLSHASDYFRTMLAADEKASKGSEHYVVVSNLSCPTPATQFKWFVESCLSSPVYRDITDETLETCMRLSKRFQARGLEIRCSKYIFENHKFEPRTMAVCLPSVARLPLVKLEEHRKMVTETIYGDILAAKLRATYDQAVAVFQTIHRMDHFTVELEKCPRCGRTKEQGRVRVQASPCKKLVGCERCMRDVACEIEERAQGDYTAYYRCPHGLTPLNELAEGCHCQTPLLARHFQNGTQPTLAITKEFLMAREEATERAYAASGATGSSADVANGGGGKSSSSHHLHPSF